MKIILLFAILALSDVVYACKCVAPENMEIEEFADNVFLGVVKSNPWSFSFTQNKYLFDVNKTIFGDEMKEVIVWTNKSSSSCGYRYKKSVEYLVIISTDRYKHESGSCTSWPVNSKEGKIMLKKLTVKP